MEDVNQTKAIRDKLTRLFRFLQEMHQLRNPVTKQVQNHFWHLWFHDLPDHPVIQLGNPANHDGHEPFILKVGKPDLTPCPEPPQEIQSWLQNGWQNPEKTVQVFESKTRMDEDGSEVKENFQDDESRMALFEEWLKQRNAWVEKERPARAAMRIYETLYGVYAHIERENETVELVLGEGILKWKEIYHPILLLRVELQFHPEVPEFILVETDRPAELYTALLRSMDDVEQSAISRCLRDLEQGLYHPLGDVETEEFLKRVVSQLSPHGEFVKKENGTRNAEFLQLFRDPVLFLRKRTHGYAGAIDRILQDLQQREDLPGAVTRVAGIHPKQDETQPSSSSLRDLDINGEDERILLSKEANAEQLKMALLLERYGSVLVQGPPGTGKTHTIANLIGHLLAQGKKVLVTSHTAKALTVLREKVAKPLQNLCVSVLDSDNKEQLEQSIDTINERLSVLDIPHEERAIQKLEEERKRLLQQLREKREQLKLARMDEYRSVVVAGKEWHPSEAAEFVRQYQEEHGWIPGPVEAGAPLPLSGEELAELYQTNRVLSPDEEKELDLSLPRPDELVHPNDFRVLVEELEALSQTDLAYRSDLWEPTGERSIEELRRFNGELRQAIAVLEEENHWKFAVITAGQSGEEQRTIWQDLIALIESTYEKMLATQKELLEYGPRLSADIDLRKAKSILSDILDYINSGKKLSSFSLFFKREWKQFLRVAKVNGTVPEQKEHFEALRSYVELIELRERLRNRWERQVTSLGGPSFAEFGDEPEKKARHLIEEIRKWLDWYPDTWLTLENRLKKLGFQWEKYFAEQPSVVHEFGDLLRLRNAVSKSLPTIIEAEIHRLMYEQKTREYQNHLQTIQSYLQEDNPSDLLLQLIEIIKKKACDEYEAVYFRYIDLIRKSEIFRKRKALLAKLAAAAPGWAKKIELRDGVHGGHVLPGDPEQAWLFRQFVEELDRRHSRSMDRLQEEIHQYGNRLRQVTTDLIEKKAWVELAKRTSYEQRQALAGWKQLMRKLGKGTGKRAPQILAEARKKMLDCQSAVPVWIMPMSRVVENFDPQNNRFDVVIVDEASQSDVMALAVLYFGKQVVVVGDDQQVSPDAVGQELDQVQKLIDTWLTDIPNHQLYDGKTSIYDLAKTSFEGFVQLREHFRCVSPIIQFSNYLSYNGEIKPLRDASSVRTRPFTVEVRVEGTEYNKVNEKEAVMVASLLVAAIEQPEYQDATFGVISLIGDQQAIRIESLLRKYLPPVEYNKRKIRCGNPSQFQGDERDVIFLSMVHGPSGNGPLRRLADPGEQMKKRFNVAASRARNQLWLVHSLDPNIDLKDGDLRKRLILHVRNPYALEEKMERLEKHAESPFEQSVLKRLLQAGYRVKPQYQVGAYRIDMVVEGGGKRLAVECDGDRWHTLDNLDEDMARQAVLERLGWTFVRIRGSAFYRDPEQTMRTVYDKLEKMGIPPEGMLEEKTGIESGEQDTELVNRIKRRAAELRREWEESDRSEGTIKVAEEEQMEEQLSLKI